MSNTVTRGRDGTVYTEINHDSRSIEKTEEPCHSKSTCSKCQRREIISLLKKIVETKPPYHSGSQVVSVEKGAILSALAATIPDPPV